MSGILIILISLSFIVLFSGMEIAFIRSDKLRIELDRKHGAPGSEIIRLFTDHQARFFSTMLIGYIISLVIYAISFTTTFLPVLLNIIHLPTLAIILGIIISTLIFLFFAEFVPGTFFPVSPNFFLKLLSLPAFFFYILFYPISKLLVFVCGMFLKIFPGDIPREKITEEMIFSKTNAEYFESITTKGKAETDTEEQDIRIFRNALDFSNIKLRDIMVPRTEIEAIAGTSTIEQLREKFISTRFSRILVYHETIDHIIGYVEVKDVFRNPADLKPSLHKLAIVPETMPANKLLRMFVSEKKNIALVVDEFGGTSGMVTIEDLLEEIVGDIEDEHDSSDLVEKVVRPNEYIFSGRLEIDYLNEKYNLNLPEGDDYATLAGLILYYHGSIPGVNDIIRIGNITIKILRASNTKIEVTNLKLE